MQKLHRCGAGAKAWSTCEQNPYNVAATHARRIATEYPPLCLVVNAREGGGIEQIVDWAPRGHEGLHEGRLEEVRTAGAKRAYTATRTRTSSRPPCQTLSIQSGTTRAGLRARLQLLGQLNFSTSLGFGRRTLQGSSWTSSPRKQLRYELHLNLQRVVAKMLEHS